MKNRIIKVTVLSLLVMIFGIRVYSVNSKTRYPINKYYENHEEVDIGNDFFDNNAENMEGYSINVKETELITIEEFYNRYDVENKEKFINSDYVFLVKVNFKNKDNKYGENAGIDLGQYMITNGAYMNYCDRNAYTYVNEFKSLTFSLKEGTDKDFVIPFTINKTHMPEEKFAKGEPQLIISLYPTRKAISLYSN